MADDDVASGENGPPIKCPECTPGLPAWMATFADLVTLLLTFFVLLLSFAKTETAKYEAALGSIRDAFGGNVMVHGDVVVRGKSPDNTMEMIESAEPIKPFPIDFLTMEGILEKHEINRASDEDLDDMRDGLRQFDMDESVNVYELPEGVKVNMKDKIYFKKRSVRLENVNIENFQKMINLLNEKEWFVIVEGHASKGESTLVNGSIKDAFTLSSLRAAAVSRALIKRGVHPQKITTTFYGDSRPDESISKTSQFRVEKNRRVEFILRKRELRGVGHKVDSR